MSLINGRCFCSSIQFQLTPPTDFVSHCHCESCRLSHAAPFVTWTSVPKERFQILKGKEFVRWYSSSVWISWGFCSNCGSSLFYEATQEGHPESPKLDRIYVSAASLTALDKAPTSHVSYEERPDWIKVPDGLTKYRGKGLEELPEA